MASALTMVCPHKIKFYENQLRWYVKDIVESA